MEIGRLFLYSYFDCKVSFSNKWLVHTFGLSTHRKTKLESIDEVSQSASLTSFHRIIGLFHHAMLWVKPVMDLSWTENCKRSIFINTLSHFLFCLSLFVSFRFILFYFSIPSCLGIQNVINIVRKSFMLKGDLVFFFFSKPKRKTEHAKRQW